MPSRPHKPSRSPHPDQDRRFVSPIGGGVSAAFSVLFGFLSLCFRKLTSKRTVPVPSGSKLPHRFSYSILRRATSNFLAANRLGRGGFGSVYRGTIGKPCQEIAVKLMDAGSLQGEREFQNELFLAGKLDSNYIVSVIGFSSDRERRRMLLVYEFMPNGSLQDCLLRRKSAELKEWKKRFSVALDIAKGLKYLHHHCQPPVIHGDIKPSNILLDENFCAKISDFGLARLRSENHCDISIIGGIDGKKESKNIIDDNESMMEVAESKRWERSPEEEGVVTTVLSEGKIDRSRSPKKSISGKDNNEMNESEIVKEYVREWIGSEIKEKPKSEWVIRASSGSTSMGRSERRRGKKRLNWWVTMDEVDTSIEKEKRRPAREWWREEYCEELKRKTKKTNKNKKQGPESTSYDNASEQGDDADVNYSDRIRNNIRRNHESLSCTGISSTPSMRGTVCYTAPEYGGDVCDLSEKCDVYSFGVLLLVLVAGRRPLQVSSSPMSEFERFNLVSWARHLSRVGKVLDLVDQSLIMESNLDREEALLCITVALVCIQKSAAERPNMKEVVGMLSGDLESPKLPLELFAWFPNCNKDKSHKKLLVG